MAMVKGCALLLLVAACGLCCLRAAARPSLFTSVFADRSTFDLLGSPGWHARLGAVLEDRGAELNADPPVDNTEEPPCDWCLLELGVSSRRAGADIGFGEHCRVPRQRFRPASPQRHHLHWPPALLPASHCRCSAG